MASRILINALSATNRSSRYVLDQWLVKHEAASDHVALIVHGRTAADFAHHDPIVVTGPLSSWWARRFWEQRHIPRILREHRIDEVIHFGGFPLSGLKVKQTAFLHNPIPFLGRTWELPESHLKPRLQRLAYDRTLCHADRYVVPSVHMRELILKHIKGVDASAFDIIPHRLGEDLNLHSHEPPEDGPLRLVTAGCWAPHKDLQATFRLLRDLRDKYGIDARLIVIGEWANERYRRHIKAHESLRQVGPYVEFTGFLSRRKYLDRIRRAHLFVSTSHAESFGIPAHEAAAMGVPVIVLHDVARPEGALSAKDLVRRLEDSSTSELTTL